MSTILVDPNRLRKAADDIAVVAQELRSVGSQAHQAAQGAPSYDGQFGPQVASVGLEASARSRALADRLTELSARLAAKAEAFEAADAAALQELASIQRELLAWVHSLGDDPLAPLLLPIDWGDEAPTLAEQPEALITHPPWLVPGKRLPMIPPDVWYRMSLEDRQAAFAEVQASLLRFWGLYEAYFIAGTFPQVLVVGYESRRVRTGANIQAGGLYWLGGTEKQNFPRTATWDGKVQWDDQGRLWFHVSNDDADGWVAAWDGPESDRIVLSPYTPHGDDGLWTPMAETKGYDEAGGWDVYQAGNHEQFLNVREIMRNAGVQGWQDYPTKNENLCGELAVFEAVGVPLEEGFRAFEHVPEVGDSLSGREVLRNDGMTSSYHLEETFRSLGWTPETRQLTPRASGDDLARTLQGLSPDQNALILNVAIDQSGGLVDSRGNGVIRHWIHITGVREEVTTTGSAFAVEFYNPYTNSKDTAPMGLLSESLCGKVVVASANE